MPTGKSGVGGIMNEQNQKRLPERKKVVDQVTDRLTAKVII